MSALALSVLLSLVSAVAYAGGAIVQEQVAVSSPGEQFAPLRRPGWWAAVALNGLGALLHVVALAYGPLSLVQPLGALTIVFALPMAALFVRRRAGAAAWRGAIMATVGLAGLLALVGNSAAQSLSTPQRVGAALVTGGAVAALMVAGRAAHRHPAVRSVLLATASGIAFGMASVFTKTVAVDWTGGFTASDLPSLGVIAVFAVAGVLLSQAAYQGGGLAAPLATLTVVNPVVAAAIGITMFDETFRYGTTGTALALASGVVAAGGLILLTTERIERTPVVEAGGFPAVDGAELAAGKAEDLPVATAVTGPSRTEGAPSAAPAGVVPSVATLTVLDPGLLVPRQQPVPLPPYAAPGPYDAYASPGPYDAPERADAAGEGEDADAVGAVGAVGALGAVGAVGSVAGHFAVLNVGPCYGGAFVPAVVLDRHRPRVKS
ncbi:DMT family transporter [Streptomyces griseosporeus]|uniref:DMT family transporter n=1 Tax=Streptomyces griseosporeus TaxID=1910 RepID=UPI00368C2079